MVILYVEQLPNAVNLVAFTKAQALTKYAITHDYHLENCLGFGDGDSDIGFMANCGYVACPDNANEKVKEFVNSRGGIIYHGKKDLDALIEAYNFASGLHLEAVFSDKDGCITIENQLDRADDFREKILNLAADGYHPYFAMISGTNKKDNKGFFTRYGFDKALAKTKAYSENPNAVLLESGALLYDISTGRTKVFAEITDGTFELLKTVSHKIKAAVEAEIFGHYEIDGWTNDYYFGQNGLIYRPRKRFMRTWNIPRRYPEGIKKYRNTPHAKEFSDHLVRIIEREVERLGATCQPINLPSP